ncbi:MAG: YnfA family protein [Gammaproteobacteria bacterium]|nr:YnfA family protein [Gammaproteobacteria bacterium]
MTFGLFVFAALLEIAGCYTFWVWWKLDKSPLWLLPGMVSLAGFAWMLSQVEASFAGRAYAAYGGVYIAASLLWGAVVERQFPNGYDMLGVVFCFVGAVLIFFSERLHSL